MKSSSLKQHKLTSLFALLVVFLYTCTAVPLQAAKESTVTPVKAQAIVEQVVTPEGAAATIYLPVARYPSPKFAGIYLKKYWNSQNVLTYMPIADQAAGKKHTSVGWFIDLEDAAFTIPVTVLMKNNLYRQLEELWKSGYVSFINLGSQGTAQEILNGSKDDLITRAAGFYKDWLDLGGGRKALIAPLQEMNGTWTAYGKSSSPEEVKQAYRYIVQKFYEQGVRPDQVWWVFAPNAWNDYREPQRAFENYYPGDDYVDIVGFSSYNYGYCPSTATISGKWESYPQIFEPYINRMRKMAPSKPLIIAETATTAYYDYDKADPNRKNQWLIENYNYLAAHPAVAGVFYFSFTEFDGKSCDFEVAQEGNFSTGYRDGLANSAYRYLTPQELENIGP